MDPYDSLPYPSRPFRTARPDHLELVARASGLAPAPAPVARVLEIGCATGGNLLAAAEIFPQARFFGIDLAASQIAAAEGLARAAGIENVELAAMDLRDLDERHGSFDYIVANGMYSWIPDELRPRLLEVIAARLAPQGIAFITHDVKPGWFGKKAVRDLMLHHVRDIADPREIIAQAKDLVGFLYAGARRDDVVWRGILASHLERLRAMSDGVIFHDYLEPHNEGFYFHEIVTALEAAGLAYVGDAGLGTLVPNAIAPEIARVAAGLEFLARQQLLDNLTNRGFRTTLATRRDAPPRRELSPPMLVDLRLACDAEPEEGAELANASPVLFRSRYAGARIAAPRTKQALARLRDAFPATLSFRELAGAPGPEAVQLAGDLFGLAMMDLVELWRYPDPFAVTPPARPRAGGLARALAATRRVPTLRHETATLDEDEAALVPLLDGTLELAALAERLPGRDVPALLRGLGRKALLLNSSGG